MKILKNVSLASYTTFQLGGKALNMYVPQSVEELMELSAKNEDALAHIVGGGG